MNKLDVLALLVAELESVVSVPVHTGTGEDRDLPAVALAKWDTTRTHDGGHRNYAGPTFDEEGDVNGAEFHIYHDMTALVVVLSDDEVESHELLAAIEEHFNFLEDTPGDLHADVRQLEVASGGQHDLQFAPPVPTFGQTVRLELKFLNRLTRTLPELGEDVLLNIENDIHLT
ncbi:hypothetical protein [Halorubellus litoreus]|uniref:Uncharacterized protein n=1 Tax=Halorubellus litoreus TaxID=755308 RepID=A0ABD5VHY9_9EURY